MLTKILTPEYHFSPALLSEGGGGRKRPGAFLLLTYPFCWLCKYGLLDHPLNETRSPEFINALGEDVQTPQR